MKRPSRKSADSEPAEARLWTQSQARSAAPYLASILRSLREHTLEVRSIEGRLRQLENRPGRPNRTVLIAIDDGKRELETQRRQLAQAAHELEGVGAIPLDPIQGLALLPFNHDNRLAWYIFDLFDPTPMRWWRYQDDPEALRRPLTSEQSGLIEVSI